MMNEQVIRKGLNQAAVKAATSLARGIAYEGGGG